MIARAARRAGACAAPAVSLCLALAALPVPAAAAPVPAQPADARVAQPAYAEPLAEGVWLQRGSYLPGRQPDGNSLLLQGPGGWVVVDTGRHREHGEALLRTVGEAPLVVLNTHWHLDHLGGNALLRARRPGTRVYGSSAVDRALAGWLADSEREMRALLDDPRVPGPDREAMRIDLALLAEPAALAPDRRIDAAGRLEPNGRALRVGVESAVSGGDLWVLDEQSGTLASGDLVTLPVPFMDTACPEAWDGALARLEALPFERLVPGHGPVMDRADLGRYRAAWQGLLACADDSAVAAAECAARWLAGVAAWVDPADAARVPVMIDHYLVTRLRAAPAERQRFCPPSQGAPAA